MTAKDGRHRFWKRRGTAGPAPVTGAKPRSDGGAKSVRKDRTKYGPTPSARDKRGRRTGRAGLPGFLTRLVIGVLIIIGGCFGMAESARDANRAAGFTGGTGVAHLDSCTAHKGPRGSTSYECFGVVSPLSAAPRAEGGLVLMKNLSTDRAGRTEPVSCTPTGTCVPTGAHATLGSVLALCLMLGFLGLGAGFITGAVLARWPRLDARYGPQARRGMAWSCGILGVTGAGVLVAYVVT
ncbi:hypothetical protein AB0451_13155 [Streptomyces sp. NPDC052000]|uniref:hypothetical protein n=1 Tax=Streptomyces sp. NPDC052000 TaxID=3155676 RepID=UPI0034502A8C